MTRLRRPAFPVFPARHTSQKCSNPDCDRKQHLNLGQGWYSCPKCGLEIARDHNAARNILRLGWSQHGVSCTEAGGL